MIQLSVKVEARELEKYLKRLDRAKDKPLRRRAEWVLKAAAQKELVPRIKRAAPVRSERGHTFQTAKGAKYVKKGNLRRKVKAKALRKRGFEDVSPIWVGSTAWYTPFVTRGTRSHSLDSPSAKYQLVAGAAVRADETLSHPGTRAQPFVDQGVDGAMDAVYALIRRDVFDTGQAPALHIGPG